MIPAEEWADDRARRAPAGRAAQPGPHRPLRARVGCCAEGLLPPEVVFAHPGFLRECDQIRLPGDAPAVPRRLRPRPRRRRATASCSPTAPRRRRARATRSRTGSSCPACLPDLYRDAEVHRLAPFFRALRDRAAAGRPAGGRRPRGSSCSPPARGARPRSSTRTSPSYLGYSLVEGADLAVRDGRVWMRSLGRLEPVDVILRRVDAGVLRPARAAPRLAPRRPRPGRGVPGRHRVGRQHARQRRAREPGACCPFLPRSPRPCSASRCACRRSTTLVVRRRRRPAATCSPTSTSSCSSPIGRRTGPRLVHRVAALDAGELDDLRRPHRGRAPRVGRPGAGRARVGADARRRRASSPGARCCARSPCADERRLRGHARRPHPRRRPTPTHRVITNQTRRRGARTRGCSPREPETPDRASGCSSPTTRRRRRARARHVAAGRREPLLARSLRRAGRGHRPPAARGLTTAAPSSPPGTNPAGSACLPSPARRAHPDDRHLPRLRRRRRRRRGASPPRPASCASLLVDADRAGTVAHSVRHDARRGRRGPRPALERHVAGGRPPRPRPRPARPQTSPRPPSPARSAG